MPKRVIDFDALWASDKLASCAEWAQSEYAWLYGLADASGSFEMTNLRVIWGRVAAIRKSLTLQRLQEIFDEFMARGLLFTWEENGKRYGHWTGSDVPGRLPAPSWRMRLEKLAPPVPRQGLAAYSARFGGSKEGIAIAATQAVRHVQARELKEELEAAQAQDWGLDLEKDLEKEVSPAAPIPVRSSGLTGSQMRTCQFDRATARDTSGEIAQCATAPEDLLAIYEEERATLPPADAMTPARRRRCARWLAAGFTPGEFRAAVRLAAATPFLAGDGDRGWKASFDWLIANPGNVRKVLAGEYAPHPSELRASGGARASKSRAERRGLADLYTGMAPRPADCGARVNPAALERIRAREARIITGERLAAARAELAPQAAALRPQQDRRMPGAADSAPTPMANDAEPRAAPASLKF